MRDLVKKFNSFLYTPSSYEKTAKQPAYLAGKEDGFESGVECDIKKNQQQIYLVCIIKTYL